MRSTNLAKDTPILVLAMPGKIRATDKKPNILVIWGDDIGTWNVGALTAASLPLQMESRTSATEALKRLLTTYSLSPHTMPIPRPQRMVRKASARPSEAARNPAVKDVDRFLVLVFRGASKVVNHLRRKGGAQGVQHGQNVDDFLGDGAVHRTEMTGRGEDHADDA